MSNIHTRFIFIGARLAFSGTSRLMVIDGRNVSAAPTARASERVLMNVSDGTATRYLCDSAVQAVVVSPRAERAH